MYIEPNTNIRLLRGVPLDPSYEHTIYFGSRTAQSDYFKSKTKHNLSNYTYQRVKRGYARVGLSADQCYDCNYMMFQNTSFGTKWFYAFITGVEYVNNDCTEISFIIDDMQSWFFDYTLGRNFVEREHTMDDTIGANLNEEPVELGEYVFDDFLSELTMREKSIVLASCGVDTLFPYKGTLYSDVFSGVYYDVYPNTSVGAGDLANLLDNLTTQLFHDRIVGIFTIPSCFVTQPLESIKVYDVGTVKSIDAIGEYVPKNNKLFTYPYNFLRVDNMQGTVRNYAYEFFDSEDCDFKLSGDFSMMGQAMLIPQNYKGVDANYGEMVTMNTTTQCSYNTSTFAETVATAGLTIATSALAYEAKPVAKEIIAAKGLEGMGSFVHGVIHNAEYHGVSNPQLMLASGLMSFHYMHTHIQEQFAERIDNFFERYGYATNELKVPNRSGRRHWNYVKLRSCVLDNSTIPTDAEKNICDIYNRGITFWNSGGEVGNYNLDNSLGE